MIGTVVYCAALMAPEIASAAADAAGDMVEATGRRFAKGMAAELESKLSSASGNLLTAASGLLSGSAASKAAEMQKAAQVCLAAALSKGNLTLVSSEELACLRDVANAAAAGGDVHAALNALRNHLQATGAAATTA